MKYNVTLTIRNTFTVDAISPDAAETIAFDMAEDRGLWEKPYDEIEIEIIEEVIE